MKIHLYCSLAKFWAIFAYPQQYKQLINMSQNMGKNGNLNSLGFSGPSIKYFFFFFKLSLYKVKLAISLASTDVGLKINNYYFHSGFFLSCIY